MHVLDRNFLHDQNVNETADGLADKKSASA